MPRNCGKCAGKIEQKLPKREGESEKMDTFGCWVNGKYAENLKGQTDVDFPFFSNLKDQRKSRGRASLSQTSSSTSTRSL